MVLNIRCLSASSVSGASNPHSVFFSTLVVRRTTPQLHAHFTIFLMVSVFTAFGLRRPLAAENMSGYKVAKIKKISKMDSTMNNLRTSPISILRSYFSISIVFIIMIKFSSLLKRN